jgi:hypothetical protein
LPDAATLLVHIYFDYSNIYRAQHTTQF